MVPWMVVFFVALWQPVNSATTKVASPQLAQVAQIVTTNVSRGSGQMVKPGDIVTVELKVTAKGKTVVDTGSTGVPYTFVVGDGRVSEFLSQGAIGLQARGIRTFTVPAALAGGQSGKPPFLPPGAELQVTMKLVSVSTPSRLG